MPLTCDCYPGCWGDHSEGWVRLGDETEATARKIWLCAVDVCEREVCERGAYVFMGDHVRVENAEVARMISDVYYNKYETMLIPVPSIDMDRLDTTVGKVVEINSCPRPVAGSITVREIKCRICAHCGAVKQDTTDLCKNGCEYDGELGEFGKDWFWAKYRRTDEFLGDEKENK